VDRSYISTNHDTIPYRGSEQYHFIIGTSSGVLLLASMYGKANPSTTPNDKMLPMEAVFAH
jgi:hypothetical protein